MKPIKIICLVIAAIVGVATWVVAGDRIQVLVSSDSHPATVVACKSKSSQQTRQRIRYDNTSRVYTPIAVSKEGYRAIGRLWVSGKHLCKGMIGQTTQLLVNRQNPESARINSFVQFWFFPSALIFSLLFVLAHFAKRVKQATALFVGFFLLAGSAAALEFRLFHETMERTNVDPVDSHLAITACLSHAVKTEGVVSTSELKRLRCRNRGIKDLSSISQQVSLEELDLSGNPIGSLKSLGGLTKLRILQLEGTKSLQSLDGLESLTKLESLAAHCSALRQIEAIRHLVNLQHLDVSCNQLTDISPMANLQRLTKVAIDDNTRLTDLSPLANKTQLEILTLYHTPVNDISPLFGNDKLRTINIGSAGDIPCSQIAHLRNRLGDKAKIRGPRHCNR